MLRRQSARPRPAARDARPVTEAGSLVRVKVAVRDESDPNTVTYVVDTAASLAQVAAGAAVEVGRRRACPAPYTAV